MSKSIINYHKGYIHVEYEGKVYISQMSEMDSKIIMECISGPFTSKVIGDNFIVSCGNEVFAAIPSRDSLVSNLKNDLKRIGFKIVGEYSEVSPQHNQKGIVVSVSQDGNDNMYHLEGNFSKKHTRILYGVFCYDGDSLLLHPLINDESSLIRTFTLVKKNKYQTARDKMNAKIALEEKKLEVLRKEESHKLDRVIVELIYDHDLESIKSAHADGKIDMEKIDSYILIAGVKCGNEMIEFLTSISQKKEVPFSACPTGSCNIAVGLTTAIDLGK